ncbi:MAG TPA: hypothetical protein VMJ10_30660 [Kofleriaceae bacterium]|nr:hypothetical protein [Kofleriaceae bacterium]
MRLWPLVIVLSSAAAHAQSPGNVRVTATCASYFVAPRDGLQLRVDGVVQPSLGINWSASWHHGALQPDHETDVGYLVAPGHHHLDLSTPDCVGSTDVDVLGASPSYVEGSLAIANDALRGTVTAPNGLGLVIGGFYAARPARVATDPIVGTAYDLDGTTQAGAQVTVTATYQHFVLAFDQRYTTEGVNGTTGPRSTDAFTGSAFDTGFVGRFGPRWTLHDVELSAGGGIGGDILHGGGEIADTQTNLSRFFLPAWATLTYKPTCDWGVQAMASYEYHPTSSDDNTMTYGVGLLYQPSSSCSDPPHLDVH